MDLHAITEQRLAIDEERELIAQVQAGSASANQAFERLLACYINNVRGFARVTSAVQGGRTPVTYDEAFAAALEGLYDAVMHVDLSVPGWRVAGIIRQNLLNAMSCVVADALPISVRSRTLKRYFGLMRHADGDVGVALVLAPEHDMSLDTFLEVHAVVTAVESLDLGLGEDTESTLHEIVASLGPATFAEQQVENRMLVDVALSCLDALETDIVRLAYGFTEYGDPLPDVEVGQRLGMPRPTVYRRRAKALHKMRERLAVDA